VIVSILALSDCIAIALAFGVAIALAAPPDGDRATLAVVFLCMVPVWLVAINSAGLYERDTRLINHTTADELVDLARIAALCTSAVLVVIWATDADAVYVGMMFVFWATVTVSLVICRAVARLASRHLDLHRQRTVIVGAGTVGQLLGAKLLHHPEYRLTFLGFIDGAPKVKRDELAQLTVLGTPDDLPRLIQELGIERVIVAFSNDSSEQTGDVIRLLKDFHTYVDIVPRLFDVIPPGLTNDAIEGIPLISLPPLRLSRSSRLLKRSLDLVVASALLVFLAPVFLVVALIIKVDSRGPIFFRQARMGSDEKVFGIYKFRTMLIDAEDRKPELQTLNIHARPGGDARMFKVVDDPRITRVGRILRRYSIDELPQLMNVVFGQMSLVGPRPLILEEDAHVEAWGRKRLALRPGITGLWQVSGRHDIPFEEMVKLDYLYVTSWSLSNDCKILLRTLPVIFRGNAL
jgi:exopolysaccharide biosynthesis polyprenyl glycosylphosphotransferase